MTPKTGKGAVSGFSCHDRGGDGEMCLHACSLKLSPELPDWQSLTQRFEIMGNFTAKKSYGMQVQFQKPDVGFPGI